MAKNTIETLAAEIATLSSTVEGLVARIAALEAAPAASTKTTSAPKGPRGKAMQMLKLVDGVTPAYGPASIDGVILASLKARGGQATREQLTADLQAAINAGTIKTSRSSASRVANHAQAGIRAGSLVAVMVEAPAADSKPLPPVLDITPGAAGEGSDNQANG
jgi:hypothetical protein